MQRIDLGTALPLAADGVTAVAAAYDAVALLVARRTLAGSRRAAALVLALLCSGVSAESAFSAALFTAHRLAGPQGALLHPAPWLASRIVLLAGTLALSAFVLRRRGR